MTLTVTLDSLGTTVGSIRVNLTFEGLTLTNPMGSAGAGLPPTWFFVHFSPGPSSLNFLAVDLAGIGQALDGSIFSATFTVDAAAPDGAVPVSVELAEVRDESNISLSLTLTPGAVTVTSP